MYSWKNHWFVCVMAVLLLGISITVWLKPASAFSDSERRALAQRPRYSSDYSEDFEVYAQDQFPLRDTFRSIKAMTSLGLFRQLDNNGLYRKDGHISRLDAVLNETMLEHAASRFGYLYDTYLTDCTLYLSIIPGKNDFLTPDSLYPSLDSASLVAYMQDAMPYANYIDIFPYLALDDYYRTDTHWRQECIFDVASHLAEAMGSSLTASYETQMASDAFQGVYTGQLALPTAPDILNYVTSDVLEQCLVTSYDTGTAVSASLYNMEAIHSRDPYTLFPDDAVFVIENPSAATDKELLLFRDSFGGSIAPYFCEAYAKVTLIDIRYVDPKLLGQWVDFADQDVLFLYSTMMLNNSSALK